MSRPFRNLFALCLVAFSIGLSGCGIYRPMYSNQRNYFKPPETVRNTGQQQLTAEQIMQQTDAQNAALGAGAPAPADAGGMPPAAPPAAPDAAAAPAAVPPPPQ
jgi:hypothetical protein